MYQFKDEAEYLRSIKELQSYFTEKRHLLGEYWTSPRLISAYAGYYMPTNMPKYAYVVKQLPESLRQLWRQSHFIDIGTGPGTFLWAHHQYDEKVEGDFFGVDHSKFMLQEAEHQAPENIKSRLHLLLDWKKIPEKTFLKHPTIFCLGHSFNEIGVNKVEEMLNKIRPTFLLFFLLGTREVFHQFLPLREKLLQDYQILYPCLKNASCPLMSNQADWCHQVIHYQHSDEIERISQKLLINRREMPLVAYLAVRKEHFTESPNNENKGRYFQTLNSTKASLQIKICDEDLQLQKIEILKRMLSKAEEKKLLEGRPGDHVCYEEEKIAGEFKRVKNLKITCA